MLDALENELNFIEQLNPLICAEIGSGSGINITALSKKLTKSRCFAIDINLIACKVKKQFCIIKKKNKIKNSSF